MKVAIILGTRPEIIKISPIIRELEARKSNFFILHTNQHFSPAMDKIFFDELKLPHPKYNLGITNEKTHGNMIAKMVVGIEETLLSEMPDWVLVQGDTNTVLAGAIAASKLGIKVGHVEAGLRSYDRTMPEEINRIITDHLSSALFCPTKASETILKGEGIPAEKIVVTGNTIVDAVNENLALANEVKSPEKNDKKYMLLTMHRPSNVDTKETLAEIMDALANLVDEIKIPIRFPVHPRTAAALKAANLSPDPQKIEILKPVGYLEMLRLIENAQLVITDSGGIQEEACILKVPTITIRENTERPESIEVGANMLVGNTKDRILEGAKTMIASKRTWKNPFGNGDAAKQICAVLEKSSN